MSHGPESCVCCVLFFCSLIFVIFTPDNIHQASTSFPSIDYLDPAFSYPVKPNGGVGGMGLGPGGLFGGPNMLNG